jgi:hypothetical protein
MAVQRFMQHLLFTDWQVQRAFGPACLDAIEHAIHAGEKRHGGEIRFAVEGGLDALRLIQNQSARERALEVFSQLRVWDTEHNNGVLMYVLLADHAVEIVADRGIHAHVGEAGWTAICEDMQRAFAQKAFEAGALAGIAAVTAILGTHFPSSGTRVNALPDAPVLLT